MLHPVLYSKTTDGRLQIWQIEQDGARYRQISGLMDGKQTVRGWTTAKSKGIGKAKTTPVDQASKEIAADYVKKMKEGYALDISKAGSIGFIEPMLATEIRKVKGLFPSKASRMLIQKKLNGNRGIADKTGMTTRTGERDYELNSPHIVKALVPVFEKYPDLVLDGEMYNEELRAHLAELARIVRVNKPEKITPAFLKRSREIVQFHLYDGYNKGKEYLPYETRFDEVKKMVESVLGKNHPMIKFVDTKVVHTMEEAQAFADEYIADKGEGAILRVPNMQYEHKRVKTLIKIKEVMDAEFEIVSIEEGSGDWSGAARRFNVKRCTATNDEYVSDEEFGADFSGGTIADAREIWKNRVKLIGRIVTIKYNGYTQYMTPNFAKMEKNNQPNPLV